LTILALETSCDDTCAAVVDADGRMRSNVISSQEVHERFGGVVPEIASRHHLELVNVVVEEALARAGATLADVDLIAATQGPGLVGALLVGLSTAKALAAARELPFAPVDHLQGHVAANFLADAGEEQAEPFGPPFVCLVASGGHTLLARVTGHDGFEVLGRTLDDAAGEAFDKGARMLGLGFPGGPALERLAADGDATAFSFPGSAAERARGGRGARHKAFADSLDFSFAGVKTALLYAIRDLGEDGARERAADLAASYQAAIVESLAVRAGQALAHTGLGRLAVGGGVAANDVLRRRLRQLGAELHVPARSLCTDNAAMIASAARFREPLVYPHYLSLDAYATGERQPDGDGHRLLQA
jgi:N6-L-threonylcarbamoyladenine synthase